MEVVKKLPGISELNINYYYFYYLKIFIDLFVYLFY